jgi:hypothetical protein
MSSDWLPRDRQGQLNLAKRWDKVLAAKPDGTTTNAEAWGIPQADVTELHSLTEAAEGLLAKVEGPDATATLREAYRGAFEALQKAMREMYWYFSKPKFPNANRVLLGLPVHDPNPTPVPNPTSRPLLYGLQSLGGFAVRTHFRDEHIAHSQAVLPGCNGCLLNYYYGPEKILDVTQLGLTQLLTASPAIIQLPPEAEGAWLSMAPRWQLDREGILGPWGPIEYLRVT